MRNAEGVTRLLALQVLVVMPILAALSVSSVLGSGSDAMTASAQAWSMATGSKLANMPMSLTIGVSFSGWQSQLGLISMASEMRKFGAVDNGLGILGDLAVEYIGRGVIAGLNAVLVACRNAAAAAHAAIVVDGSHVHRARSCQQACARGCRRTR